MSAPRFYCEEITVGTCELSEAESRHALQSLRLHAGDEVVVFDGRGHEAVAILCEPPRKRGKPAAVEVSAITSVPRPKHELTIVAPGSKGPRLTWMVEKLTELNTTRILLTNFEHSVVRVNAGHAEKLQRTAIEACKQSRRTWLPLLGAADDLRELLATERPVTLLVAHPEPGAPLLGTYLQSIMSEAGAGAMVVIGPEAGLGPRDLTLLHDAGGRIVRLGTTILRVETAAIAIAATWAATVDQGT